MDQRFLFTFLFLPLFVSAQTNIQFVRNSTNKTDRMKSNAGIKWVAGLSWSQIKEKAKNENKFIFLDCYTTWCGPCKAMDKIVYPNDSVGLFMNKNFISVKVQMDKTEYDDEQIRNWYRDADMIQRNYSVNSFPTFLFFQPDGKPMHKVAGYKGPQQFIVTAKDALDPRKQYYAVLSNYKPGKLELAELKGLAKSFKFSGKELAWKMATEYFSRIPKTEWGKQENLNFMMDFSECPDMRIIASHYLNNLSGSELKEGKNLWVLQAFNTVETVQDIVFRYFEVLNNMEIRGFLKVLRIFKKVPKAKEIADNYLNSLSEQERMSKNNLQVLADFTTSSKDHGFHIFYNQNQSIDSIMGSKNYAKHVVLRVINKEEVEPYWDDAVKTGEAPWDKISDEIRKKYNKDYSEELILNAKVALYGGYAEKFDKHWDKYIKYYIEKVEKFGTDTTSGFEDATSINNFVFRAIFYHSIKSDEINTGLRWMEGVIRRNPKDGNLIDTYANLLYKAGRSEEAIRWQEKAVVIAIEENESAALIKGLQDNLRKMKKNIPTWTKEEQ